MFEMLNKAVEQRFMKSASTQLFGVFDSPAELCDYLENYSAEALDINQFKNIR